MQLGGGGDARDAHAAGDQRGVGGLAAEAGEDALGGVEAGDVVGVGVGADEHDVAALGGGLDGLAGRVKTTSPLAPPGAAATPVAMTS